MYLSTGKQLHFLFIYVNILIISKSKCIIFDFSLTNINLIISIDKKQCFLAISNDQEGNISKQWQIMHESYSILFDFTLLTLVFCLNNEVRKEWATFRLLVDFLQRRAGS